MAEDRFLRRWSARKQQAATGEPAPDPSERAAADEAERRTAEVAAAREAEGNRAAAEAVDLDSLDRDSDYTVFLKRGVPEALKRQALRRLWRSNPVLACLDGLNDYDQDFADPALNMAVFKSAWQVGRGYLVEDRAEASAQEAPAPAAVANAQALSEPVEPPPEPEAEVPVPEHDEPPAPKVSLRKRLGLDDT